MTETTVNPKLGIAELEKVFEEYKNKLKLAEQESSEIINRAWRKAESIIAQEEEGRQNITKEIKRKATEEATNIILEAKNQAQQIIREADESVKKEANLLKWSQTLNRSVWGLSLLVLILTQLNVNTYLGKIWPMRVVWGVVGRRRW